MKLFNLKNKYIIDLSPPVILACGFLVLMLVGAFLLKLPFATTQAISWIDALFTATSAVTITGLSVFNVGATFTLFGQIVIALLVQVGGIGFMTFAVLAALSLTSRMGIRHQALAQEVMGQTSLSKVSHVAKAVMIYSLIFEAIGFVCLTLAWHEQFGWYKASYYGLFHAISAFNNAGFSLFPAGMADFASHTFINMTISTLYILGGIGFVVLMDIKENQRWVKLQTNTKIVLCATLILNLFAFVLIWVLESQNSATLGAMPVSDQAMAAWFQATVPRSSGFNTISIADMNDASTVLMLMLMFIGGGSLSTAGGIKIGTFVVLILATRSFLRRHNDVRVFHHTISPQSVMKALAVTSVTSMLIFVGIFLITAFEKDVDFLDVVFEVVSAVCTVGLSRGLTENLSSVSEVIIIFMMFAGRLGPLTLAYFIATPQTSRVRYPTTQVQIG